MSPRRRLVVFTRFPRPGATKTRLIPAIGAEAAADLQRRMTEHTLRRLCPPATDAPVVEPPAAGSHATEDPVIESSDDRTVDVEVRYDGGDLRAMQEWLGTALRLTPQGDGDLGCRMHRAASQAFRDGARRVVIVGVDAPGIRRDHVNRAYDLLDSHDLVLGPARDGGYYLIGLSRPVPSLFEGIAWGGSTVLEATLTIAADLGLRTAQIDELGDVDRPEDLPLWEAEIAPD